MFRKASRQTRLAAFLTPSQMNALNQANQLAINKNYIQAALFYDQLAKQMEQSNHPRRAANFHAQAAHLYADGKDDAHALAHAQAALALFIKFQMINRIPRFYSNITQKMRSQGMLASMAQLQNEFGPQVGVLPSPQSPAPKMRGQLPGICPQCGAPVRSDEVDWIDPTSVECIFCGSVIKTI